MIQLLDSLLLLLFLTVIISAKPSDFYKHGLFWGGKPFSNATIHDNGNWQVIEGSSLYFYLPSDKNTLISYNIGIEALRIINGLLLPQDSTMDIVQVRCVLDGIPLRYSSSYTSTYDVEQRTLSTLSSTFAVNLKSENHVIFLEWKKTGTRIEKWIISGGNNEYAVTVQAEHESIQSLTESKDKFLYIQDMWKPLSDILTFYVNYDREVILGYSFTAQPQLQSFIKDRNMEYIMSILSIDGTTFEESSDIFGTNGWNPSSHVLSGTIKVQLEKGYHSVYIMWRKHGSIFKGWSSSPSYLDGFTNSRNLFVLMEDYDSPALYMHNRDILHSNNQWSRVGNEENTLFFNLVKESAVLITYALPVSQFENPNFDSNVWAPLSNINSRLIVDNVAYTYAGDTISFSSRKVEDLFGSLALVLPAGSHSIYLQWRSDGFNWTTLNDFGDGFSHGNNLLVYVSSENSRPNISSPAVIYGYEDISLIIQDVQVSDLDTMLIAGVTLELSISITFGTLDFPNAPMLAQPIVYIHGIDNSTIRIKDNVRNINSALRDFIYIAPSNWYGEDTLSLTLSDDGNLGFDGAALIATFTTKIIIQPVDDMFTVQYKPYQYVRNVNEAQNLAPIELNDIDAQDSFFRVQLSSTCGILSLCLNQQAILYNKVVFFLGDGINDTAMDFQASFSIIQSILKCIIYTPETVCNQAVHQEVFIFRIIDVSNGKDIEKIISLDVIRENLAPEIVGGDLPRWKLRGLNAIQSVDINNSASITYKQYPSLVESSHNLFNEQLIVQPFVESSSYSELSVFSTAESGTYAFSIQFKSFPIKILESSYLEINSPRTVTLLMMEKLQNENFTAQCFFGNTVSVATIYLETNTVACNVVYQSSSSQFQADSFKIDWLKLTIFTGNDVLFESNYAPLFIVSSFKIFSLSSVNIFPLSQSILQIDTNLPGIVDVCILNEQSVLAIVYENVVNCRVPPMNYNTSKVLVRLESKNGYFKSNELILNVLPVPVISSAYVDRENINGLISFIVDGQWDFEVFEITNNIYCILDTFDIKFVATQFSELQIICQVSSNFSYLLTTNDLTIHLLFDNQATNSIRLEQNHFNTIQVAESYELVDYYSKTWMETGFITLLGDIRNLISKNKSSIDCSFGGQITIAIIVDDFTILCPIPNGSLKEGSFSVNGFLLIKNFDNPFSILKVPVITRIFPDRGFLDGGTEIIIYGSGFMPSSVIYCLFDELFVPALYLSESSISCVSVPHRVGNVYVGVTVDGIFAIPNVPIAFSYIEAPVITNISPKAGPVEGGFNLSITGNRFEQVQSFYCRFGSITSSAIFQSSELLTCMVPYLGYESSVEFALISDSIRVLSSIQFRYLNPAVLLGIHPTYGSMSGGDIVVLYGTEFIPGTAVMCIFEDKFVPARILNYSTIECVTPYFSVAGLVNVAVSVEGYEMITRSIKFSFIDPIKLLSIEPSFGSPYGETLITVLGSGFSKISNIFCMFGNFSTPAFSLTDDRIICTTAPNEIGTFQFSLYYGDNYQKIISTPLLFTFVNPIKIISVSPTASSLQGGTQVIVKGESFSILEESMIESKMYCKFGTYSAVAVILSNSSISCLSPSFVSAQIVEFSLIINEIANSENTFYFEYFNAIALTGIYPNRGSVVGGDSILFTGLSFTLKSEIYCLFGIQLSNSRIINSTAIECISPEGTIGEVKIGIDVGGYSIISDELFYTYEPILTLSSISMQENFDSKQSRSVLVAGTGFSIDSNLQCMFENISSIGIYVNESYVTCIIPFHTTEQVSLKIIQTLGFSSLVSNSLIFKQYSSVVINSISPRISLIEGGIKVTAFGSGFDLSAHLFCQFGEDIVAGLVETNKTMTCITPPSSFPRITTVRILSYDQAINCIPMSFRYVVYPLITDFEPRHFSTKGKDSLMVYGLSFIPGSNATCIFDSVVMIGRVLSESKIECKTPIGLLGMVNFSVELEEMPLKSLSSAVYFVTPVSILEVDVNSGSTVGGTNVTITGSEFLSSSLVYCIFENTYVPAIYISTSAIICTSVPHAVGTIFLRVMIDNVFAVSKYPLEFTYKPSIQLYSLMPEAGALAGGTQITVHGVGFSNFGNPLMCNFGSVTTRAMIYSDDLIQCTTPSVEFPALVNFQIMTQGGDVSIGSFDFRYFNNIEITSIFPVQGSISGGEIVLFRGIAFPALSIIQCTFGNLTANGLVRNSTVIECETPYNASVSEVNVGLKLENYYYTSENIKFSFVERSLLVSVYPLQTSTRGGVNITLILSKFSLFSEIICIFDILEVAAIQISNTSIVCTSPAHSEGLVPLNLKVNGIWANSENDINMNYIVSPLISHISPASGPNTGNTVVNVFGTDFDLLEDSWLCNFGNLTSNVIIISDTNLICNSPAFSSTGFIDFFLSSNDKMEISDGAIYFKYFNPVFLKAIYPTQGSILGGEMTFLYGAEFIVGSLTKCIFGNFTVDARVLNVSTIQCETPSLSRKEYFCVNESNYNLCLNADTNYIETPIGINIDGYTYISDTISFKFIQQIELNRISPTFGIEQGGKVISVIGSGFPDDLDIFCIFGNKYSLGRYISKSMISCISPASQNKYVEFSIKAGASNIIFGCDPLFFNYYSTPIITSLIPSTFPLLTGATVTIEGINLSIESMLVCKFDDLITNVSVVSDAEAFCLVPSGLIGVKQHILLNIISDSVTIYTTKFDVGIEDIPSRIDIYPKVFPTNSISYVTIVGGMFYQRLKYYCYINEFYYDAVLVSTSKLVCGIPSMKDAIDLELSIYQENAGVIGGFLISFQLNPIITLVSSYLSRNIIILVVENFNPIFDWVCVYDTIEVNALLQSDHEVICSLPQSHDFKPINISLSAVQVPLKSNTYVYDLVNNVNSLTIRKNLNTCSEIPGITSFRNDDSSLHTTKCELRSNKTISFIQKMMIDQKLWFKKQALSPPRSLSSSSFDYANVPSTFGSLDILNGVQIISPYSLDRSIASCAINSNTPCFLMNQDVLNQNNSTSYINIDHKTTEELIANPSLMQAIVINSVNPYQLNTNNDTWITIEGRGFSNNSFCLINNDTVLLTTYVSQFILQCVVESLSIHKKLILELEIIDVKAISINKVSLVYELCIAQNLKVFTQHTRNSSDLITTHIGSSYCTSKTGCDINPMIPAVNDTYNAFLDLLYFNNVNLSITADNTNNLQIEYNKMQTYNFNKSAALQQNELFEMNIKNEIQHTLVYPTIVLATPLSFDLSFENETYHILHCYGLGFVNTSEFSLKLNLDYTNIADCYPESNSHLICLIFGVMVPNVYSFDIIVQQKHTIFSDTITFTMKNTENLNTLNIISHSSNLFHSNAIEYRVVTIRPLSGSIEGSTVIAITGNNLISQVQSCTFKFDDYLQYSVPIYDTSISSIYEVVYCVSPAVSKVGVANLNLDMKNGLHLPTGYYFRFFDIPQVSYIFTSNDLDNDEITIFGSNFPIYTQSFCNITFRSGFSLLLTAKTISTTELNCIGAFKEPFYGRVLAHVSVSFNGQDFINSDVSIIFSRKQTQLSIDYLRKANVSTSLGFNEIAQTDIVNNLLNVNPSTMSYLCDNPINIPINHFTTPQDIGYYCYLDNTLIAKAFYVSSNQMICNIPAKSPGIYELSIKSSIDSQAISNVILLQCLLRPKILSARYLPHDDGTFELIFVGLNLHPELNIYCRVDNFLSVGSVDSNYEVRCLFNAIVPGLKFISIESNGLIISSYNICLTVNILKKGGSLVNQNKDQICEDLEYTSFNAEVNGTFSSKEIRSFLPRSGLTIGNTAIEIVADNIDFGSKIVCRFDDVEVDAIVVDFDRILCSTPPSPPRNTSLTLKSSNGYSTWCCGWFSYHSIVKIYSVAPSIIDRIGGNIVQIQIQSNYLILNEHLFCHFNNEVIPAFIIDNSSLSCVSPFIPQLSSVNIAVGSEYEIWSDSVILAVYSSFSEVMFEPKRGSVEGNTSVDVLLPLYFLQMNKPVCLFGTNEAVESIAIQTTNDNSYFILRCISPSNNGKRSGSVDIYIRDSQYEITPEFYAGTFTYETPADISSMFPTSVNQGNEVLITILGVNFYDSPLLSCLINDQNMLQAQWLSNEVIVCLVPAELSINLEVLRVRVSNNGQDLSKHSQILQIIPDNMIVYLGPLSSFSMGNNEIKILFTNKYHGKLYCRFDKSKSIVAFQVDSYSYICLTTKYEPGIITLEIVDSSNFVLAIEDFVYYSVPILNSAGNLPVALTDFDNDFNFTGINFFDNIIGRFRGDTSNLNVGGSCKYDETIKGLVCSKVRSDSINEFLFLDISINGKDFIESFATIQVLEASQIVSVDPLYVVSTGNYPLGFMVDKLTSGYSTLCSFEIITDDSIYTHVTNSSIINNLSGICYVPKLPLNSMVSWSIFQKNKLIFGAVDLVIIPQPSIRNVNPSVLYTGVLTSIEISFQTAVYAYPNIFCLFQNDSYSLKIINSTLGVCAVNPIHAEISELFLQFQNEFEKTMIAEIKVIDSVMDLQVENNNVLDFSETKVSIKSEKCLLQNDHYCSTIGAEVKTLFISSCEMSCFVGKSQNIDKIRLDICTAAQCFAPIYSISLNVISSMSVIALSPAKGQVQGGIDILLFGTGFPQNVNLQCTFGLALVDMIVLSSSRAICHLPPQNPGFYDVNIVRSGFIVSNSIATFEYLPLLSWFSLESNRVSSLGGTVLTVSTQKFISTGPYECRFDEKYTPAFMINETTLSCASPAFDVSVLLFSISLDREDISTVQNIFVDKPPSVVFMDPIFFPALKAVVITIVFDEDIVSNGSEIFCKINGFLMLTSYSSESTLLCYLSEGLFDIGDHVITLEQNLVDFYNLPIYARSSYSIQSITPLTSFDSISTSIILKVNEQMSGSDFSKCCFDDRFTPAIHISTYEWQCFSPNTIVYQDNLYKHNASIGLARAEGFCEYFGFEFSFYKFPLAISISSTFGSIVGGTPVTITFKTIIEFPTAYCRIGAKFSLGQIDGNNIHCVSMKSPVGIFDIEISTNGIDFIPTNFKFEFLPILPSLTSPEIEFNKPEIYFVEPNQVSSISQSTIFVKGAGFRFGAYCELSSPTFNSMALISKFISESEIECIVPVHEPGTNFLSVLNIGSQATSKLAIEFVTDPSIYSSSKSIYPNFGSKTSETFVTIYGNNLNFSSNVLLCLIDQEWTFAIQVTSSSLQCIVPSSTFSGKVMIRIADQNKNFISGHVLFEYIDDPLLFDAQPSIGTYSTDLLVTGIGFLKFSNLTCMLGDVPATTAIISNTKAICKVPMMNAGTYSITFTTNGQHYVRSGLSFEFIVQSKIDYLWPLNGPALRGGTILSVHGEGFKDNIDLFCMVDMTLVQAVFKSPTEVQCRIPPHLPGLVNVSLVSDGALMHPIDQNLQFLYVYDASVDKITPEYGYTSGDFPLFVFGSNFLNTTGLGCKFGDMKSRGVFLSNVSILCLTPSPLGLPLLARLDLLAVEVTLNGLDYTDSNVTFAYSEPCDSGFFCPGSVKQLCPNGTYCPQNARNFTLCQPGTFQPQQGQSGCVICPIGYICPDQGMPRPVNCPAGLVCDSMGLRVSNILCPGGAYCLNGTKSTSVSDFQIDTNAWSTDFVTGVVTFNVASQDWSYKDWPSPAVGKSRPMHPPEPLCDGLVCAGGNSNFLAEAPFPCPIGHFCRAGAGTQIPVPKNFSTPQRCFDGFFCPRGSVSPEGTGPCPNGYFCPTQLDAIKCPRGHYCPGVGNTAPIECYPGTYNPFDGMGNCTVCPTGHICPTWGTLLPELCPAGFVCVSLGLSYPVIQCPAGYWCDEGTLTIDPSAPSLNKPKICKNGQFCLGGVSSQLNVEWIPTQPYGGTKPQTCEEGTYCQAGAYLSGGTGLCFKGHYCPPNTTFPIQTPRGNFASDFGSVAPTLCYPGTYAPLYSQVNCLNCPSGHQCLGYGVYVPSVCGVGTTRQSTDSVTCSPCPTGTYAYEVGAPDLSLCLPCPPSRICGTKSMISLSQSDDCPAGYLCGYGTDRSSQFGHLTPAGFHSKSDTIPADQYNSYCNAGFYCPRGTPTYSQFSGKCPVSYFCPRSTPAALNADTKCPMLTSSLSQLDTLQGCRIADVDVCDKALILDTQPMEDLTYLDTFNYELLDDTGLTLSFDSSLSSSSPTGEIQVVRKIYPINVTSSSPVWINDTVEAFRACPLYGSGNGGEDIIIIGRNFRDTSSNYCRFRACYSANLGTHPRRCQNQIKSPTGEDLRVAGNVSEATYIVRANYISSTRISCPTPEYLFEKDSGGNYLFDPDPDVVGYSCQFLDAFGVPKPRGYGNLSYVRYCDVANYNCQNLPEQSKEYFNTLTLPCTPSEIYNEVCPNKPELYYMFNPCMSGEAIVEVTNDGEHYSGGNDLDQISIISTVRFADATKIYDNFKNTTVLSTFATYTYVYPEYVYDNPEIMEMERRYCSLPRYSEEDYRERENGWFKLNLLEVAHVQVNLDAIPDNMVYNEHYRIAIFIIPSRCTVQICSSARVRLSPEEFNPCRKPKEFSYWFQQTTVPKNLKNNITIFALDDMLFKIEIQILHGLYVTYAPLFLNTTVVRIASPSRAITMTFQDIKTATIVNGITYLPTRVLTKYVSFEQHEVNMQYFFTAIVQQTDNSAVSQPLNMPPLYSDYERGRALIMNNVSSDNDRVPTVLDIYDSVNKGTLFWNMPASTADESKEQLDAYFETFQETTWDPVNGYVFQLNTLVLPYFPYFSNCDTFDSYIPIWLLLEGKECTLPDTYPPNWSRYKFPALPDQDRQRMVGPFDFFAQPIADWCERSINCNYEEKLSGQDNTPRFFELGTDSTLFTMIRYPLQYFNYTGRKAVDIDRSDGGGALVYNELLLISGDNFIPVTIDHSEGDLIPGCVLQCFPRVFDFSIAYYQETVFSKRIIYANLVGSSYDFNQDDTSYEIKLHYYALGFLDLVMNFSFPISIFIVIFLVLGFLTVFVGFVGWLICRLTTLLQNPPQIKIFSMLALVVPPGVAGVVIGVIGIFVMTALGNYLVNGYLLTDPNSPQIMPLGTLTLDIYPIQYSELLSVSIPGVVSPAEQADCRTGRIGSVFAIVGILCFTVSSKMFFPKEETKREREIAEKRTDLAKKELWDPVLWKKANFMFCSFTFANILVCMVEFSYSSTFADYIYTVIVLLIIVGEILKSMLFVQLNDFILIAPIMCAYNFCTQLVTFGSPDFLAFLLSYFVGVSMQMFQRVFQKTYTDAIYGTGKYVVDGFINIVKNIIPRYMSSKPPVDNGENKDFRRREVEGVPETQDEADSVEPILEYFGDVCSDTQNLFYFPYFVYLLMQYRNQLVIPEAYGIRQSDMLIYMTFQVMMMFFQPFLDVFNHAQCELFHGWKIYEYLVYSRYRFLQRETRWKSMENSLDECIDESLRRIDQMCFSSQYYLMITVHMNGIIYIVLAFECWLSINYSPFSDPAFFMIVAYYIFLFVILRWITLYLAIKLKVWKIKHENTAWHLMQREEDDLDIPAWEEIKGASTDAYLMNQRITSETFRYKFLNYNRTWLINQLPQLLTPRTMRRSRPYLINQFARIINARRDDISDDDENEKDKKFGPVALTAPSRNIIRWWLGKARRRIRLRTIVEPLIKRARGAQCEQCLSRKQLQVEYEIDVDKMGDMYDNVYPGDEEVDQVQWKQFWINNQRYHTICLACLTRRKEIDARNAMKGAMDPSLFDDGQEDYPDWGPVFLSAASKAMLLNWYRKAQRLRAGKRGNKRKDKVIKNISDDEGEDLQKDWLRDLPQISGATKAIATKWMRTARARLQKKHGKGAGLRESDVLEEVTQVSENFKSGRKSKMLKK